MKERNIERIKELIAEKVWLVNDQRFRIALEQVLNNPVSMNKIAALIREHGQAVINKHIGEFHTEKDIVSRKKNCPERVYTENDMVAFGEYMMGKPLTDTPVGSILEYWQKSGA
jgi:hypothetical protein